MIMAHDLALRLGCLRDPRSELWQLLPNVGHLRIPTTLPSTLRPMLGKWLQTTGRLAHVNSVCCRSWVRNGEVMGWIDLESIRAGEPDRLTPEERFTLDKLDTPDGLLKTVLKYACRDYQRQSKDDHGRPV